MVTRVPCPTCHREVEWTAANPYRPFCSERCRLVDLGAWLTEQRAIPEEPADDGARPDDDTDDMDDAAPLER